MHAFLGQHDHARAIYEQGRQIYPQTSRFLRAFALFEKRQGRLQVGSWRLLCLESATLALQSCGWHQIMHKLQMPGPVLGAPKVRLQVGSSCYIPHYQHDISSDWFVQRLGHHQG